MSSKYDLTDLLYFSSGLMMGVSVAILLYIPSYGPIYRQDNTDENQYNGVDSFGNGWKNQDRVQTIGEVDDVIAEKNSMFLQDLTQNVNLLIWVKTSPLTLHDGATAIKNTWGKRADKLLFISSTPDASLPAIGVKVREEWSYDADLIFEGFRYIYENHLDDAEWFMQADEDTFVIVENLQYFLSGERAQDTVYYGLLPNHSLPDGHSVSCVGGGYLLSRQALKRFGERSAACLAKDADGREQVLAFNICMDKLGIDLRSTEDALGRSRFHCLEPDAYLQGSNGGRFRHSDFDPALAEKKMHTVSDYTITFHGLKASKMSWLYYYTYQLAAYGLAPTPQQLNTPTH